MDEVKEFGEIYDTELGFEHGVLTFMLTIRFGAVQQGFGGFGLDDREWSRSEKDYIYGVTGAGAIIRVLEAMSVQKWEDLKGKPVWAYREHERGKIIAIMSPGTKNPNKKFNLEKYFNGDED